MPKKSVLNLAPTLTAFLLLVTVLMTPAQAAPEDWFETNKPVKCGPFTDLIKVVTGDKFREIPIWIGQSGTDDTGFTLFRNAETKSWTLVQYGKEIACVLGIGPWDQLTDGAVKH